jgi:hypothetical protein
MVTGDLGAVIFIVVAAMVLLSALWVAPLLLDRRAKRALAVRVAEDAEADSIASNFSFGSAVPADPVHVVKPTLSERLSAYFVEFLIGVVILGLIVLLMWFFAFYQTPGDTSILGPPVG